MYSISTVGTFLHGLKREVVSEHRWSQGQDFLPVPYREGGREGGQETDGLGDPSKVPRERGRILMRNHTPLHNTASPKATYTPPLH